MLLHAKPSASGPGQEKAQAGVGNGRLCSGLAAHGAFWHPGTQA